MAGTGLAKFLGVFSIGLGLHELMQSKTLGYELGMEESTSLIQAYGARELLAGVGILASKNPTGWIWARIGGDMLDIATLVGAMKPDSVKKPFVGIALGMVVGVTVLDIVCAAELSGG